jgi:iron complex transport system permease protein
MINKGVICCLLISIAIVALFAINLFFGSVDIPVVDVWNIITGKKSDNTSWHFIIIQTRLPQALTAMLCGAALSASGLMLQTAFRNPLAGPSIFGIDSGAGLGVAIVMLLLGGNLSIGNYGFGGYLAILSVAFVGAMVVTVLIFVFSTIVHSNTMLLIIGIMIGYITSSIITLLNFFATEEGVRSYMIWGMGNFSNLSIKQIPIFATLIIIGLTATISLIKPLNAMLLGERYAKNLGINTTAMRNRLLVITGLLIATSTAFCGPIAFIGLAVPHIARLLLTTENHRHLLPVTILIGSAIALLCNFISYLPSERGIIPINAITPVIGAPVIIYVISKKR